MIRAWPNHEGSFKKQLIGEGREITRKAEGSKVREGLRYWNKGCLTTRSQQWSSARGQQDSGTSVPLPGGNEICLLPQGVWRRSFPNLASRGGTAGELLDFCFETQRIGPAEKTWDDKSVLSRYIYSNLLNSNRKLVFPNNIQPY